MSKEEKIQKILDSWEGSNRLKTDSWNNVRAVLAYHGFSYEKKSHWVCRHPALLSIAKDGRFKDLLHQAGLGPLGEFSVAVTHGKDKNTGMVLRVYLNNILKAIELVEILLANTEQK